MGPGSHLLEAMTIEIEELDSIAQTHSAIALNPKELSYTAIQ